MMTKAEFKAVIAILMHPRRAARIIFDQRQRIIAMTGNHGFMRPPYVSPLTLTDALRSNAPKDFS